MSSWDALTRELDAWADAGQQAALWWRDDDAIIPTRALDQLIDIAGLYQAPLTLAVIPARTTKMLFHTLKGHSHIRVAQHGYAHVNNAGPGQKKIELGGGFDDQRLMRDLKIGRDRLSEIFEAPVTMLVPPWNRIEERVIKQLPALGYRTLSAFAQKPTHDNMPPGLTRLNTHSDPIAWRGDRGFAGDAAALTPLVAHLTHQRMGGVPSEPAGLLTHHLDHDPGIWQFTRMLVALIHDHPGARWVAGHS